MILLVAVHVVRFARGLSQFSLENFSLVVWPHYPWRELGLGGLCKLHLTTFRQLAKSLGSAANSSAVVNVEYFGNMHFVQTRV